MVRVCGCWLGIVKEGEGQELKATGFTTTKMIHLPKSNCSGRKFLFHMRGYTRRQVNKRFVFRGNGRVPYTAQTRSVITAADAVL